MAAAFEGASVSRPSMPGHPVIHPSKKIFPVARNRVIVREWPAGTPEPEIRRMCEALPGATIPPGRIAVQAAHLKVRRPDRQIESRPPVAPPPGRLELLRQVAASLAKPAPPTAPPKVDKRFAVPEFDPGPSIYAEHGQVQRWAAERGIQFVTWEDLPKVNAKRVDLKQPEYKRANSPRSKRIRFSVQPWC
jgi:hypothetical protein